MVRGRHDTLPMHFMELRCNQKRRSHKKNRDNTAHNQNPEQSSGPDWTDLQCSCSLEYQLISKERGLKDKTR
jgi:hypothetical protein